MPSGKIHAEITLTTAGFILYWGITRGDPPDLAVVTALGCALGIVLTPDLDVVGTRADGLIRKELGFIPAVVWGLLWNPYSALIPHRSMLSHGPIVGTLIRIVYIAVPLAVMGILPRPGPILARILAGLFISDNLHIGADFITSGIKGVLNEKRNKKNR